MPETDELQDAGPNLAELTEARMENRILRQRLEINQLRERLYEQTQNATDWRSSFHEAVDSLRMVHPALADLAENSNLQRFSKLL